MNEATVPQDLLYALNQVVHNFGAMTVAGGAILARWPVPQEAAVRRRFAWWVLAGWVVQGLSGTIFGALSMALHGQLPDIRNVALAALLIKMACVVLGFTLTALYLKCTPGWSEPRQALVWNWLIVLAATALSAAAFLRWFA